LTTIRTVIADDHRLVRFALRMVLDSADDIEVVAEAADGAEALQMVETHQPQVLITDITMQRMNGLQVVEQVARQFKNVRVIVLSMHSAEEYVLQSLQSGASGYLLKDSEPEEVRLAVRAVARGESYLTPQISKSVIATVFDGPKPASPLDLLTPRQREVMQMLAEGRSTKEIARLLKVTTKAIEGYRTQVMERLGVDNMASLVRLAVRTGLISASD
jgi:DNA-binding NarL/FixJ family response regulator